MRTSLRILFALIASSALASPSSFAIAEQSGKKLGLHIVPTSIKSYRLLAMSRDNDGFIWAGSIHRAIHRYDARSGAVETIPLPYQATASSCICVGKKVYILGQAFPKLIVFDRSTKEFRELAYPSPRPDVWYGTEAVAGRHIYLFDRGGVGVIKWDTATDVGKVIPWPYKTLMPSSGNYEPQDQALWCRVWDVAGGKYQPLGVARLDVATDQLTGWFPFPSEDEQLVPFSDPKATFLLPYTLQGKIVPFDFRERRWCKFLSVPGFGERFGFMGGPVNHQSRCYFSLSTYNGSEMGCDDKPYHFLNAILEFDPEKRSFNFLTLETKDAYYQIAYLLSANGEFFATGSNIQEADGSLNRDRQGEVVFWQSLEPR